MSPQTPLPQKPIIYQNGVPNFGQPPKQNTSNLDLFRRLLELNAGLLLLVFLTLLTVGGLAFFNQGKSPQNKNYIAQVAAQPDSTSQPQIASEGKKSPVFINDQVISIDKAFNSQPTQIKLTVNGALKKEVFGYLPYWSVDKLDQIDTKLLTSVAYFGLEVGPDGEIIKQDNNGTAAAWQIWQSDPKLISFMRKLKSQRIKTLLTFKAFSNDNIEKLVQSPQASKTFIDNVLYQMSSKALDGVNLDFEYVGTPPDGVKDKFSILISDLNKQMKRQYPKSTLTLATYARSAKTDELFDVQLLAANSDGLVIMGYDFHTPDSGNAGAVAPMGGEGINLLDYINAYLDKVPPEKLILAVPYYGYDWPTQSKTVNSPVAAGNVKILSYAEIAEQSQKLTVNWDDSTQTPWYNYVDPETKQTRVVHFENVRSLGVKYDFINKRNLQGMGIWALGLDGRNTDLEQLLADKFAN
jgi:spore germination protein YaaH